MTLQVLVTSHVICDWQLSWTEAMLFLRGCLCGFLCFCGSTLFMPKVQPQMRCRTSKDPSLSNDIVNFMDCQNHNLCCLWDDHLPESRLQLNPIHASEPREGGHLPNFGTLVCQRGLQKYTVSLYFIYLFGTPAGLYCIIYLVSAPPPGIWASDALSRLTFSTSILLVVSQRLFTACWRNSVRITNSLFVRPSTLHFCTFLSLAKQAVCWGPFIQYWSLKSKSSLASVWFP